MAITSKFLRDIEAEARPIIERQINDAKIIAGLRDVVSAAGGDWGALKALIKARVEDDNDESGEGKRVKKIREKADCTVAYDDILGSNMNENNFSSDQSYAEAKGGEHKIIDRIDTDGNRVTVTVDSRIAEILARNSDEGTTPKVSITKASSPETADLGITPHDAETGEILTQEQPVETASQSGHPDEVRSDVCGSFDAGKLDNDCSAPAESASDEISAPIPHSSEPISSPVQMNAGEVAPPASPAPIPDSDVPAFLRKDVPVDVTSPEFIKLLRPFCQNLDDCHGHGRECSKCKAVRAA